MDANMPVVVAKAGRSAGKTRIAFRLPLFAMCSALSVSAVSAFAQAAPLLVEVGKTVEYNVVYARGWSCDDPSLVEARIATRGDQNFWIVKGAKVGITQCRVGTDPYAASYVFDVRVVARKSGPPAAKPKAS